MHHRARPLSVTSTNQGATLGYSFAQGMMTLGVSWVIASIAAAMLYSLGVLVDVYHVAELRPGFLLASGWLTVYGFFTCGAGMVALVAGAVLLVLRHAGHDRLDQVMRVGVPFGLAEAVSIGLVAATSIHWLALVLAGLSVPLVLLAGGRPPGTGETTPRA